jgi:DNA polymerase-3 subunit gamma/tau
VAAAAPDVAPEPAAVAHPKGPGGLDTDALRRSWPDVLEWLSRNKRVTWTFVSQNAQVLDYDGQRVLLGISTVGLADTFRRGAHADYVRQALIDVLGVDARVDGVPSEDSAAAATAAAHADPPPSGPAGAPPPGDAGPGPSAGLGSPFADPTASDAGAAQGGHPSRSDAQGGTRGGPERGTGAGSAPQSASWSDAPPPPDTAPSWASPLELAKAAVAVEAEEAAAPERVVDDTAISDDDESIDDLTDVGVPVVERILGGTVIAEDSR